MPLISRAIPTLLRGVSQSSDSTKQADHADIQDNANSDPVLGLTKRSGTQFISNLITSGTPIGNAHVKFINRDINERYIAIFTSDNVRVFELDGTELTVHKPDGVNYLNVTNPRDQLKTVTIADFTFVVNTNKIVKMNSNQLTTGPIYNDGSQDITITNQAIVFIKQCSAQSKYTLEVDGRKVIYDTADANDRVNTSTCAEQLRNGLFGTTSAPQTDEEGTALASGVSGNTFTATFNGPVINIFKNDNSDFNIKLTDSRGNTQTTLVKQSIQRFTDLPIIAPNGYVVEVKGDRSSDFDNYYVKFTTSNTTADGTIDKGTWEETVKVGINKRFSYSTMPHVLIRQADGHFRFAKVNGETYGTSTQSSATFTSTASSITETGTYTQSNTVGITVTLNNHGFSVGESITIDFTSGTSVDGTFTVTSVLDTNTFTVTSSQSNIQTTTGNCSVSSSNNTVTITKNNHGFVTGELINVESDNLTNGQFIITVVDANTFTYESASNEGDHTNVACTVGLGFTLPKWGERTVGDLDLAPDSSFVGSTINNIFFFRNRLGFLSSDNVILSRVSAFFDFFPETVLSVLDSDPIDVAASHTKVAILKNAVNMGEKLILFSDQTQFTLTSSSDSLTPASANIIVSTEFESSDNAAPVGSGASIYYLTEKGNFSSVREYIFQPGVDIKDASNITIHVPRLIPNDVFKIAVSTNQDILVLASLTNPNVLYINRWLYGSRSEKILNSWFTYTFNSKKAVKDVEFLGTDLLITCDDIGESVARVTLEKLSFATDFREPNALFEYHLDHKVSDTTTGVSVSYDADTDTSTFTVPYKLNGTMKVIGRFLATGETSTYIDTVGAQQTLKPGQIITTTNLTNNTTSTIEASGDYRNSKFIIGEPYEMHYRFSTQKLTESAGGQRSGEIISGRLQLKHFYLKFEDSGFFKVEVTPENNTTSTHKFTGRFLGATSSAIGDIILETGTFRVPILSRADRVNIDIKNDTFLPSVLSSAEYEAMFHMRSSRM